MASETFTAALPSLVMKRTLVGLALTGALVLATTACEPKKDPDTLGPAVTTGKTIPLTDSDDVVIDACTPGDEYRGLAELTVTNHSSKPSTYLITVGVSSADGSLLIDTGIASISGLAPNQATKQQALFSKAIPDGSVCKVQSVSRFATPS